LIRRILILVKKDFRIFLADPVAIGLGFVVPLVMILIFGLVFGGSGGGMEEMMVLGVNEDEGPAGQRLLRALDGLDEIQIVDTLKSDTVALDSARARHRVASGHNSVALIVPRDFSAGLKKGEIRLSLLEDPKDKLTAGVVAGLLQQQVFQVFPGLFPMSMMNTGYSSDSLVTRSFNADLRRAVEKNYGVTLPDSQSAAGMFPEEMLLGSDPDTAKKDTAAGGFSFQKALSGMFKVARVPVVGQNIVNPGIAQSVAGPAVMFMLFAVGAIAASLLREMRDGTVSRLRVIGALPGELLFAKYLWSVLLGSAQLCAMMVYGRLLFHLDIVSHPFSLLLMIVTTALVMSAVALIIAAIGRTEEQATGYQVTIILAMSAIGGAMIPSFIMPAAVKSVAVITPVHWAMEGFHDIFWRNQSLAGILPEVGVLLGMAALLVTISVLIFHRRLRTELG
jgi:ABC-2 type transport system permease protein